jgi:hypothetical protein
MAVHTELRNEVKSIITYPKLMHTELGNVVFFLKEKHGTLIFTPLDKNKLEETGHYSNDWNMDLFSDFPKDSMIMLQNK